MMLGSFAGDVALAQGAAAVILAGGILPRLIPAVDFALFLARFRAKGRFEAMMGAIPVALVTRPDPGLLGAATMLAAEER